MESIHETVQTVENRPRIMAVEYNFCYEYARGLINFPVDQNYEIINQNDKNYENRPIITTVVP